MTGETYDFGDGRGPVPAHRHHNYGSVGGWVANTAYVSPTATIGRYAVVFGKASVFGDASVFESTRVFDQASVFGPAWVAGHAVVRDNAVISEDMAVDQSVVVGNAGWSWACEPIPSLVSQRVLAREILSRIDAGFGNLCMVS